LQKKLIGFLDDYNSLAVGSKRPMKLVLFMDA